MGSVRQWLRADLDGGHIKRPDEPFVWRRHWWTLVVPVALIAVVLIVGTANLVEAALWMFAVIVAMLGIGFAQLRGSRKRVVPPGVHRPRPGPEPHK